MSSLVIGYGNDLRCDDGAGRVVADRVEALQLEDVEVRSLMQLTPELALDIAGIDTVVFVDASVDVAQTTMQPVNSEPLSRTGMSHYSTPGSLLTMAESVGLPPSRAFTISIPVTNIDIGMELTPMTEAGVETAVAMVKEIITG